MKLKDIFLATIIAFIWGTYFSVSKIVLSNLPPLLFGFLRYIGLWIFTFCFTQRQKSIPKLQISLFALITFLNISSLNIALDQSENITPLIVVNEISFPLTILISIFYLREKILIKEIIGFLLCLLGMVLIIKLDHLNRTNIKSILLTISASLLFSIYNFFTKTLSVHEPISILRFFALITSIFFLLSSLIFENWSILFNITINEIILLLYVIIIVSFLTNYWWLTLLKKYPLYKIIPFTILVPIIGIFVRVFSSHEQLTLELCLGTLLVITGISLIEFYKNDRNRQL